MDFVVSFFSFLFFPFVLAFLIYRILFYLLNQLNSDMKYIHTNYPHGLSKPNSGVILNHDFWWKSGKNMIYSPKEKKRFNHQQLNSNFNNTMNKSKRSKWFFFGFFVSFATDIAIKPINTWNSSILKSANPNDEPFIRHITRFSCAVTNSFEWSNDIFFFFRFVF